MGKELFDSSETAKKLFSIADEALGFPLSKICFEGPADKLTSTEVAQPAILTVSTICFTLAREKNPNLPIVSGAGHSLGEYSALVAAEAISFADAVLLVHKRGKYMQTAVPAGQGKMVAVLGKEVPELEAALSKVTSGVAQIANINSPGQIVVAGDRKAVDEFLSILGAAKAVELPVSAPFHCALMKPAADALAKDLAALQINKAKFPVYANFTAEATTEPEVIRKNLVDQVCGRVRWVECMEKAIKETSPTIAVEFGAGNVLQGLLKRINGDLPKKGVESVAEAAL